MALDLDTTYRAILQAARKRTFITYGEIAAAHEVSSTAAQALLPAQLEALMRICHAEGWPFAPAIVFHEPLLGHAGSAAYRDRLVAIVRSFGIFVSDATAFIRTEQDRVFDWAPGAPDHLPPGSAAALPPAEAASEGADGGTEAASAARRPLDLDTTFRAIVQAARRRAFITYGEIAAANGVMWNTVRSGVPAQLYELMQVCRRAGWPFLPVIVVNARGREEGGLTPESRDKVVRVARELGVRVDDPEAFIRAEQERVFDWAPRAPEHLPAGSAGGTATGAAVGAAAEENEEAGDAGDGDDVSGVVFVRYFGPVLDAVRALGGVARSADVVDWLRTSGLVPAAELTYRTRAGNPGFANKVGWARFYLDRAGFLTSPRRGVWALTEKGRGTHLDLPAARAVFRSVQVTFREAGVETGDEDTAPPPDEASADSATGLFSDPQRQFWLGGSTFDRTADQTERFLAEGIWQGGDEGASRMRIARMRPGDCLILKSSFTQKRNLPFDAAGQVVPVMRIKAVGCVRDLLADGRTVLVDWTPVTPPRDWYFNTYRTSLVALDPTGADQQRLIRFAVLGEPQEIDYWRGRALTDAAAGKSVDEAGAIPDDLSPDDLAEPAPPLPPPAPYTLADLAADGCFLPEDLLTRALERWRLRRNLILQGPPGTGKSWLARRLAAVLLGSRDARVTGPGLRAVQFHPALSYEDFVRGWRPDGSGGLVLVDGAFLDCVTAARAAPERPHVLLIEEINRGNPARIFGDMLTLIEDTKRTPDEAIDLSAPRFPGERVFVPDNLFLIGTMNLADRSLALVDLALRRRFAFLDLTPQFTDRWRDWCVTRCGLEAAAVARIGARMGELNAEIAADRSLGPQFRVGHSFLTPDPAHPPAEANSWFRDVVKSEIGPLLEEYRFDAPDRARDAVATLTAGF